MPWSYNSEDRQGCRSLGQSSEEGEVRWSGGEEDEHVQDDVKMTDGGKKKRGSQRSGPANQRADSTFKGTSILYVFITLSKLKSQFMVFKHIQRNDTDVSASWIKEAHAGWVKCAFIKKK